MFKRYQQIHFVGIGGAGMSGIAEILLNLGYRVTGSDVRRSETIERLEALGAKVFIGHEAAHVEGAHVVVYSSAVARDNIEVQVARQRAIPVIPRAEMLAELMRLKYGIAVAGTHGKTTTTSMVGAVLAEGRYDPTIIVGGRVTSLGGNVRLGQGEFLVAEADESDGSFLKLDPTIAVVTTIDAEHLDHYGTLEAIQEAFVSFVSKVPFYGAAVLCLDQPNIQRLIPRIEKRVVTYGLESGADLVARRLHLAGMSSRFDIYPAGEAPIAGVTAADLAEGIRAHGHRNVTYLGSDRQRIVDHVCEITRPGDIVLTLGAGDVSQLGPEILQRLEADSQERRA